MTRYLLALTLVLGAGSLAQAKKGEGPCAKDRETLCGNVEPGGGAVMKCMKENEEKLSPECKAHREEAKRNMKGVHEACQADAEKFCSDAGKGRGRMMRCMKQHKEELSEACKAEMSSMKERRQKKGA